MVTVCNERSAPPVTPEALEVLAFNMERGIYPEALGDFLAHFRPDVILACELDVGCARSGGLDVPRELARRLGMSPTTLSYRITHPETIRLDEFWRMEKVLGKYQEF